MPKDSFEHINPIRAQEQLAAIVDSSDDAIIGKTLEGIITSWNNGAQKIYGYSAAEAIGQHIDILIPQDRKKEMAYFLDIIKRGELVEHFETKRLCKDGRIIDISVTISPIKDVNGKIIGASTIARDITDFKRMNAELREAHQRLLDIIDFLPDASFVIDKDKKIIAWNRAMEQMSGMPKLKAAETEARDKLVDIQLQNPSGITITSAMVRRLPAGNWHRV